MTGEAFRAFIEPYAIALDGFVSEGPWFDDTLPAQNFNHHEGVPRLETRATCAQVLVAIRQGLFKRFRDSTGVRAEVFVNDCDEDVCTSWWLLSHLSLSMPVINPLINRLVSMVDLLDTTAGAYPFPEDMPALEELAWIFAPYRLARSKGFLQSRDPLIFNSVVDHVCENITSHIVGKGQRIHIDTRYDIASTQTGWSMVREIGAQARTGMFADGMRAFVSVSDRANGRRDYVVGRMSAYIRFPVQRILQALNEAEGLTDNPDQWGGGETIGGSPRIRGSTLSPADVIAVIRGQLGACP